MRVVRDGAIWNASRLAGDKINDIIKLSQIVNFRSRKSHDLKN